MEDNDVKTEGLKEEGDTLVVNKAVQLQAPIMWGNVIVLPSWRLYQEMVALLAPEMHKKITTSRDKDPPLGAKVKAPAFFGLFLTEPLVMTTPEQVSLIFGGREVKTLSLGSQSKILPEVRISFIATDKSNWLKASFHYEVRNHLNVIQWPLPYNDSSKDKPKKNSENTKKTSCKRKKIEK